jgi:hypothetical protein
VFERDPFARLLPRRAVEVVDECLLAIGDVRIVLYVVGSHTRSDHFYRYSSVNPQVIDVLCGLDSLSRGHGRSRRDEFGDTLSERRMEILVGDTPVDILRDSGDVASRIGTPLDSFLSVRRLTQTTEILVASPNLASPNDAVNVWTVLLHTAHRVVDALQDTLVNPDGQRQSWRRAEHDHALLPSEVTSQAIQAFARPAGPTSDSHRELDQAVRHEIGRTIHHATRWSSLRLPPDPIYGVL